MKVYYSGGSIVGLNRAVIQKLFRKPRGSVFNIANQTTIMVFYALCLSQYHQLQ